MNQLFEALAHPTRREILELLKSGSMSAGAIAERFDVSKPTLSGHFAKLKDAGLLRPLERTPAEVLVTTMDPRYLEKYLRIGADLRAAGVNTEVYLETAKLGNQLTYADRKGFRIAIIAGENEFAKDVVQVKNLATKSAADVALREVVQAVKTTLKS